MGRRGRKSNSKGMKWNRRGKEEEPQGKEKEPKGKRFPYMNLAFSRSCARNAAPTSALSTSRRTVAILTLIAFAIRRWEQPEATVQTGLPTLDALRPARYRRGPGVGALRDGEGSWVMLGSPARQSRLTEKLLAQTQTFSKKKFLFCSRGYGRRGPWICALTVASVGNRILTRRDGPAVTPACRRFSRDGRFLGATPRSRRPEVQPVRKSRSRAKWSWRRSVRSSRSA